MEKADTYIPVPLSVKNILLELKQGRETYGDTIQRLISGSVPLEGPGVASTFPDWLDILHEVLPPDIEKDQGRIKWARGYSLPLLKDTASAFVEGSGQYNYANPWQAFQKWVRAAITRAKKDGKDDDPDKYIKGKYSQVVNR